MGSFPERVTLGRSGLSVSPLAVSGGYGVDSRSLIRAFDRGVNYWYHGSFTRPGMTEAIVELVRGGRRDELVRLATDLALQLVVASPDLDGATPAVHRATTLFVVKDDAGDVHLAPYHYRNLARGPQPALFAEAADDAAAACRIAPA